MIRERGQQREMESIEGSNEGGWKVTSLAAEQRLPRAAGSKILEEPGRAISDKKVTPLTA